MNEVIEFFQKLLDTSDWPPRWHCGKWSEFHGWLYIISDLLIWSAYFAIPLFILRFISRRSKARFVRAYFLFAAFILACGSTHLLDAITFWFPAYRLNALVRFITGVVSWATVFYMIKIMPQAMTLKTAEELEKEIADRKKAESELRIANQQLNNAQDIANMGHWQWNVAEDKIIWSDKLYQIYDVEKDGRLNFTQYLNTIHPEDRERVQASVQRAIAEKNFPHFHHRIVVRNGQEKIISSKGEVLLDEHNNVTGMIGTAQDVTEQQLAQQELLEKTAALETTNGDLQRFAYVASHDLQEPLRKILTFASLLEQQSSGYDEKAKTYVQKIVQSSHRMQRLIEDVLHFSSIREGKHAFEKTDLQLTLNQVLSDMEVLVSQSGAVIKADSLPEIEAVPSQMRQLFQNLLGNAIKFAKQGTLPQITISCSMLSGREAQKLEPLQTHFSLMPATDTAWQDARFLWLHVADEGIGFEPVYAERVFELFQRLHTGSQYGGTGIGLAICKRIVENHHGAISVRSEKDKGTVFSMLLPASQQAFGNG